MTVDAATLQPYIDRQRSVVETCARAWQAEHIHIAGQFSPVDALFVRGGRVYAVAEVKTRDLTLDGLRRLGSYLVTFDKLVTGRKIARQFGAHFVLIVGLSDALVWWWIADHAGEWQARLETARTTTAASSAGGEATRANAFLSLDDMRVLASLD